jgi:diguanylate cyclase
MFACMVGLASLPGAVCADGLGEAIRLVDASETLDAWPAVTVLVESGARLTPLQAVAQYSQFVKPAGFRANLGVRREAVWLRIPVAVPHTEDGRWIFEVDYASIDRIDLYVMTDGMPVSHQVLGDHVPFGERVLHTRSHTARLVLERGMQHELLLRVQTTSSMILPIRLSKAETFHARESGVQMLQGLVTGLGLCLVLYSLAQAVVLRDRVFVYYAASVFGAVAFFFAYYGLGPQHLWSTSQWLTENAAPWIVLVAVWGGCLFLNRTLQVEAVSVWAARALLAVAVLASLAFVAFAAGLIDYRAAHVAGNLLGPMPMLVGVPVAWVLARRGDRAAWYVLVGWGVYAAGVAVMVALLRGYMPVNGWTLHAFQIGSVCESLMWMLALGVRVQEIRRGAEQAERERDALHSLAHTDALTGLLNRRGLQHALESSLAQTAGAPMSALFLLDLDGFKPVNDTHGHDAGDELLACVARRLQSQVRSTDLVARLGGDEFVVVARGLQTDAEAERVGAKLLAAFGEPFHIGNARCTVGATIGYALAPHDGRDAGSLLKRADAAMYAGKQAGKQRVQRGGARTPGMAGMQAA